MTPFTPWGQAQKSYWDELAPLYQKETRISTREFHYGPVLPGDRDLQLLPEALAGKRCLEIGCGAGQNSIALARKGADCLASDISHQQLALGRELAARCGVQVEYAQADMDALPPEWTGFDLIHSTYGLPFAADPAQVIQTCADRLVPGGQLLISMGHPVYAGEWWEVDEDKGMFLTHYFHLAPDVRESHGEATAQSRAFPLSEIFGWLQKAGLQVDALLEPSAANWKETPPGEMDVPYYSEAWAEQQDELTRFPIVAIFRASKPTA
jgi:2-polyprenyl-3-methyl-5-hydroxy-6-metoxy-1,4-benzoquinol methylase